MSYDNHGEKWSLTRASVTMYSAEKGLNKDIHPAVLDLVQKYPSDYSSVRILHLQTACYSLGGGSEEFNKPVRRVSRKGQ